MKKEYAMNKRTVLSAAVLAFGLLLSACAKLESWTMFDNNCSGNAGLYNEAWCADYVAELQ